MYATMTSKGQLTLPKAVREQLHLASGVRILVTVVDGRLIGIPQNGSFEALAGLLGDPPDGPASLPEIDQAVADAVAEHVMGRASDAERGVAA